MNVNINSNKRLSLLTKLANKFANVKALSISFFEKVADCVLLMWQILGNNDIFNNNCNNTES